MCTLTFYPKPDGAILTFSRDEQPSRSSVDIVVDEARDLVYPKDRLHGGTWLAMSRQSGRVTCLLNGAFLLHERHLPYRKSRGLVLLESFQYASIEDFFKKYSFEGIEPFTMISGENGVFHQFRWDGMERFTKKLDAQVPQIWSSATLYPPSVQRQREGWFSNFLGQKNGLTNSNDLWQFHKTEKKDDTRNSILMHRETGVQTVSISQINLSHISKTIDFQYNELKSNNLDEHSFAFGNLKNTFNTEGVLMV